MLLEKPRELVSREELRSRLWPRTIVDFDHGLNKAINKIRGRAGATRPRARASSRRSRDVAIGFSLTLEAITAASPPSEAIAEVGKTDRASALGGVWKQLQHSRAWKALPDSVRPCCSRRSCFGLSTLGIPHQGEFAWLCSPWKIFPATLRRITSPRA